MIFTQKTQDISGSDENFDDNISESNDSEDCVNYLMMNNFNVYICIIIYL